MVNNLLDYGYFAMGIMEKLLIAIVGLLLVALSSMTVMWQLEVAKVANIQKTFAEQKLSAQTKQAEYEATIVALNKTNDQKIQAALAAQKIAQQQYEEKLHEIQTRVSDANDVNQRLSDKVRLLNSKLSSYPAQTRDRIARTSSNNLVNCSATTTELERLARLYYNAYQRLDHAWPVDSAKPTIVVTDKKTGYARSYDSVVEARTTIDHFKLYTP